MTGRLSGKVALITGTGGGQGRVGALRFAQEGARIVGCDLDPDTADETMRLVLKEGGDMVSLAPLDLYDEAAVASLIRLADEAFGGFDILWNNASAMRFGLLTQQSLADFEFTQRNEVTLLFTMVQQAVEVFRRRGAGVVINTASVSGSLGSGFVGNMPGLLAHSVSKAAVARMSVVLAVELAELNVRVNSISPGIIETPATAAFIGTEDAPGPLREPFAAGTLSHRVGTSEDIANAALYLASDEASYVTGIDLVVDGGSLASGGLGRPDTSRLGPLLASAFAAFA